MRKITCLLLLIQSGLMIAQTKTVVTPYGEKVTIHPSAPGTADNGLTITDYNVQLGGTLVQPSILITNAANTLSLYGLQPGNDEDQFVTLNDDGVLHKMPNTSWSLKGNAGTNQFNNFIGTTDQQDLIFKTRNVFSGRIGQSNTSFGYNTSSSGVDNVAVGTNVLKSAINTTMFNVGVGTDALSNNTEGSGNVGIGHQALNTNTSGTYNVALGKDALLKNTTGSQNTAIGLQSLYANTTGINNIGIGIGALNSNATGLNNIALGATSLNSLTNDSNNIAIGNGSVNNLIAGDNNIVVGSSSGTYFNGFPLGGITDHSKDLKNLRWSVILGSSASPLNNGDINEVVIGYNAIGRGSNTVTIGNSSMTSIGGYVAWSNYSDSRLKKNIVSSTYGLDFINKLRPVLYNMKTGTTELQTGFIAQEVETVANSIGYKFSGVVKPQSDNDFYSLRYSEFVVPLVKAVQEQQTQIESLQKQLENKDAKILEFEKRLLLLEQKMK